MKNIKNEKNIKDIKNVMVTVLFIVFITGFMLANILLPDSEFSYSERRRLTAFPEYSTEEFFSGDFFEEFEKYTLDQFIFRDFFRRIKAYGAYYLMRKKDNNKIYIVEGNINKIEYPLNEKSVLHAAEKLNEIYKRYLEGKNVSYAIIPDKNYFVAAENGYLSIDYDRMQKIMNENIENMRYINLFYALTVDDYYKTDIHWRQEKITDVAEKLLKEMGNAVEISINQYTKKELYPFYGSYYGQAALKMEPDTLIYLTNEVIEKAVVYDYELKAQSKVYATEKFKGMDSYDVFLSGAKSLISITNPEATTDKELILFRDSFGSSIAPLLLPCYSKIILVDLRYIATDILGDFIDFSSKNQDVLFLYNTQIINNSYMLK
ncbi:MAG TPA: hypothetical protein GXX37_03960 [Clostridiaceae bacterium]|nr:hypothetical protein [Clostridiaceae bacterium]